MRAEQIRLHADHVSIAAGVVQDGFEPGLLLNDKGGGKGAHARAGAWTVGNVDEVDSMDAQLARLLDERTRVVTARRHQFDRDGERAARERVRET